MQQYGPNTSVKNTEMQGMDIVSKVQYRTDF